MPLNNIRISTKLPAAFVVLSLTVVLAISWMGYRDFKASLIDQSSKLLGVLTAERGIKVETWFDGIASQVSSYAGNPAIVSAVQGFGSTFGLLMDDPVADLHAAYITNNPHPLGDKNMLDRAPESIPYHFQHGEFHPVFNAFNERLGLYDFFLFNLEGDLIYSVEKETDFATNFDTGPYKDSGLGLAFRAALQGDTQTSYFVDFMPYAPSHDAPAAFISSPVVNNNGATIGVLAIQVPAGRLNRVVTHEAGLGVTGDLTIIGPDLLARTASRFTDRHEILGALTPNSSILEAFDATASRYAFETGLSGDSVIGATHQINVLGEDWLIVGEFEISEVLALAVRQRNKTLAFTTIAMMIVAVCGWLISRTFSKPLDLVVTAMTRLTQREYEAPLPDLARQDEIGDLSRAVTLVADRLQEFDTKLEQEQDNAEAQRFAVEQLGTGLKRLADGDFSAGLDRDFAEEYEQLRVDFNDTVTRLGETIADLKEFSTLLETQTDTISRDSNELSQRTENQASTLEETAAAIDQITETITQSSNDLHSAERLILEADGQVKQGRTVVETTTKAMDEIEKSSSEISSIIRVVDDIAFQTNLLALNAGVEAARAGDAGRGFAVVASEVRQLAMRSTEAVCQIKALIEKSTANVGSGVTLVRETEAVLMEIVRHMEGISTVITSVTAGAAEQSGSIGEINTGVNNLDRVTQQNAMMVENSNASVQSLTSEATKLVAVLSNFKVRTNGQNVVTIETAQFSSRRSRDPSALSA